MDYARIRFLRGMNTHVRRNIEEPSSTAEVHEYRTAFSLEFAWEKAHGILDYWGSPIGNDGAETRLYAGTSEYPALLAYGSDNAPGADNQQGRPLSGTLRDCTPSSDFCRVKIQSELTGDRERTAEMTVPVPC